MEKQVLQSETLRLRPFEMDDIPAVYALAREKAIADTTLVPHPYAPDDAEAFIKRTRDWWRDEEAYVFAITDRATGGLRGAMGIHPVPQHKRAEVGYWIGKPYWGRGIATAALKLLIQFGFETLELNRIEAGHFDHNQASGAVMQKAGMLPEGIRRGFVLHRDGFKDLHWFAILRADYDPAPTKEKAAED